MVEIYILKCEKNKIYVGKSERNVWKRINTHFNNKGAKWTQQYKPIDIVEVRGDLTDRDETKVTIEMMREHGISNVRGGCFAQMRLNNHQKKWIKWKIGEIEENPGPLVFSSDPNANKKRLERKWGRGEKNRCPGMHLKRLDQCRANKKKEFEYCNEHSRQEFECPLCKKGGHNWRECPENNDY